MTRDCPFPRRSTWAIYKVGPVWRVLAPARAICAHPADSWAGDFTTHAEALAWATDAGRREAWLDRSATTIFTAADRILWIEGMLARCTPFRHQLLGDEAAADA